MERQYVVKDKGGKGVECVRTDEGELFELELESDGTPKRDAAGEFVLGKPYGKKAAATKED